MRAYLEYRMRQERVTLTDIKELLNVSERTVRNKMSGKTDFTFEEVKKIRNEYFPKDDLIELFEILK